MRQNGMARTSRVLSAAACFGSNDFALTETGTTTARLNAARIKRKTYAAKHGMAA
jgi:hypothetical protein